jgi:PAS domain S-box-containing protein
VERRHGRRDVTELNPDTEEEFRALIEHSTDIVSVLDEEGRLRYQSPSVERVLGYDQGALLGDVAFEYVHPDDRETVAELFGQMVERSRAEARRVEFRFRHADGSWVWLEANGSNTAETPLDGYVVNSRDITERIQRERQLARQNERLDEFASIVSHDLRNPLSVVEGSIELYHESGEREHYDRCLEALDRMNRLVGDLLELARQDEAVVDTEPVPVDEVATKAWEGAEGTGTDLTVGAEFTVEADRGQLRRLLENLFENAVRHGATDTDGPGEEATSHEDGGHDGGVSVTLGRVDAGFYVADDGPGIPEDERGDVFDPGYSTSPEGTGYGLRIVDRIARVHGWEVDVTESAAGGARFEVTGVESP